MKRVEYSIINGRESIELEDVFNAIEKLPNNPNNWYNPYFRVFLEYDDFYKAITFHKCKGSSGYISWIFRGSVFDAYNNFPSIQPGQRLYVNDTSAIIAHVMGVG